MKGKTIFLSTALAGALGAASAVQAVEDAKVFPGNICNAEFGEVAADIHNHPSFIHNIGPSNRFVVCPIVRDNTQNLDGLKLFRVRVRSDGVDALSCSLFSFNALGSLVASDSNSTTSAAVTTLPLDIDISTKNGTYSLRCSLPPDGEVLGYQVNEFENL